MVGTTNHILHVWDYHHGQSTRVVVAGCPPLRGDTMREKQNYLAEHYDHLRALACREPRGHRNMLGAFLTDPVTEDGQVGVIFIHPDGYFDACGDSTFSVAVGLLDTGIVPREVDNGEQFLRLDTVGGRVDVRATLTDGHVTAVAMRGGLSQGVGEGEIEVDGLGKLQVEFGWGGLLYAFVSASQVGIQLDPNGDAAYRRKLLETGGSIWQAVQDQQIKRDIPGGEAGRQVDLITLYDDVEEDGKLVGSRVAHFYGPQTMGRTPSGTGTSARVAYLHSVGKLEIGAPFYHESQVGLRFNAKAIEATDEGVVADIETMSFLMSRGELFVRDADPFPAGFSI